MRSAISPRAACPAACARTQEGAPAAARSAQRTDKTLVLAQLQQSDIANTPEVPPRKLNSTEWGRLAEQPADKIEITAHGKPLAGFTGSVQGPR
jgi:hypothetical protein